MDIISQITIYVYIYLYMCVCVFTDPITQAGCDVRLILSSFNLKFFFAHTPNLSYYLPIAGGRKVGFIPFQEVLAT